MAYLGQPFPGRALGSRNPLRQYALGRLSYDPEAAFDAILADMNGIIQYGVGLVLGSSTGSPATLATAKQQTYAAIDRAAAGNTALAAQAKAQASSEMDAAAASAPGGSTLFDSITSSVASALGVPNVSDFLTNNWPWLLLAGGATYYAIQS